MVHNLFRNVEVVGILDEREAKLATAGVTPKGNIRLKIGNLIRLTVQCLFCDSLKIKIEGLDEPLLCCR